jgi:hypothetical protein
MGWLQASAKIVSRHFFQHRKKSFPAIFFNIEKNRFPPFFSTSKQIFSRLFSTSKQKFVSRHFFNIKTENIFPPFFLT